METTTKHNHELIFGRREAGCPRCAELAAGAPARKGWGYAKREFERMSCESIRRHSCYDSNLVRRCGVVCTFGDW